MGPKVNSKVKAKSECAAESSHLPKRRKIESLITSIQENNIEQVIMLVKDTELVKTTSDFSFKEYELSKVPPLVIAVLLDNKEIISCLAEKEQHFNGKKDPTNRDKYIFDIKRPWKKEDRPQVIENLEIVGSVLILHSHYQHGVSCLSEAKKLRERSDYYYTDEPASEKTFLECLAFPERSRSPEFRLENFNENSIEDLFYLKSRAFIIAQQFLNKYGAFPNLFVVHLLLDFALKSWKSRELSPNLALVVSIYLLKLYDSSIFENIIQEKSKDSFKLILSTFEELILVVDDKTFNFKLNSILNYDLLILSLNLCCQCQVKARQIWAYDEASTKEDLTTKISDSILGILKILISFSRYEIKQPRILK
jgi:hypothetical protein